MKIFEPFKVIEKELLAVEEYSNSLIDSSVSLLLEAGGYVVKSGGKKIRPGLTVISGRISGAEDEKLIPVATVMEYMHTATLVHDDIVDGANYRRGKRSLNSVFGSDVAVLVGDYLFAKAIYVLANYGGSEVLKVASKTVQDMAEGELLQLERIGDIELDEDTYFQIIYRKTASLISTCCEVGAILGNAEEKLRNSLKDFGLYVGYAFQIVDDVFDYALSQESTGKPTGKDIREGKVTYPLILALRKANEEEKRNISSVFLKKEPSEKDVELVKEFVLSKGGVEESLEVAKTFVKRAKECLSEVPESSYKTALLKVADFVVSRTF